MIRKIIIALVILISLPLIGAEAHQKQVCSMQGQMLSGNYALAGIVVESGITGPPPSYDQSNSYSGGDEGPMGGYEDLPNPVPATRMVYNHVGRHLLGGYNGDAASLPMTLEDGQTYSHTYSYTLPEGFNEEYVYVVGLMINQSTGEILNAGGSTILEQANH